MGIYAAHSTQALAIKQQFLFELDLIVSAQLRAYIHRCRGFKVWGAVFESQLMVSARPPLVVEGALAQNEMVVVQVELRRVVEQHFPHLAIEGLAVYVHLDLEALKRISRLVPKFDEALFAREPIGL